MFSFSYLVYMIIFVIILIITYVIFMFILDKYRIYKSLERYMVFVKLEKKIKELNKERKNLFREYSLLLGRYYKYNLFCTMEDLLRSGVSNPYLKKKNLSGEEERNLLNILEEARLLNKKLHRVDVNREKLLIKYINHAKIFVGSNNITLLKKLVIFIR